MPNTLTAQCACGSVKAELVGPFREAVACHCETCRRQSGHYIAATQIPMSAFHLKQDEHLSWWASSHEAKRAFCSQCGSLLFWQANGSPNISIFMGCLDAPTGIKLSKHIFQHEKGDYYDCDGEIA